MLDPRELADVAEIFGASEEQIRRDHLLSHILHALTRLDVPVVVFGGTALAHTHLPHGRLSEDVDLYAPGRRQIAAVLDEGLPKLLSREFPGILWDPSLTMVREVLPGGLVSREGLRVRLQLLEADHEYQKWPTEVRALEMRYSDVPSTALRVPTLLGFVAQKTTAWVDRAAERDLYDLAALAKLNALTVEAAQLVHHVTGWTVTPRSFDKLPRFEWHAQLAHQTRDLPYPEECLDIVRKAYANALGWHHDSPWD